MTNFDPPCTSKFLGPRQSSSQERVTNKVRPTKYTYVTLTTVYTILSIDRYKQVFSHYICNGLMKLVGDIAKMTKVS